MRPTPLAALLVLVAAAALAGAAEGPGPFSPAPGLRTLDGDLLPRGDGWRGRVALDAAAPGAEDGPFEVEALWGDRERMALPRREVDRERPTASWTFALEALHGPATLRRFARPPRFELAAGPRLRVRRPDRGEGDPLSRALASQDDAACAGTVIARVASLLLAAAAADAPLAPPEVRLRIDAARALVDGASTPLAPPADEELWTTLRVPAGPGRKLSLALSLSVVTRAPLLSRRLEREAPLAATAAAEVRLSQGGATVVGRPSAGGATGGGVGAAELLVGPLEIHGERMGTWSVRLQDAAGAPLVREGLVLLRHGRPLEAALDRGEPPPAEPLPASISAAEVPAAVARQVAAAINPDTGTLPWLTPDDAALLADAAPEAWRALGLGAVAATAPHDDAAAREAPPEHEIARHAMAYALMAVQRSDGPPKIPPPPTPTAGEEVEDESEFEEEAEHLERGLEQLALACASERARDAGPRDLLAAARSLATLRATPVGREPRYRDPAGRALGALALEARRRLATAALVPPDLRERIILARVASLAP